MQPTTTDDRIRVLAPFDPAIDFDAVEPDAYRAYVDLGDIDAEKLPLHEDKTPVWFTVRPLSKRMLSVVRGFSGVAESSDDEEERHLASVSFLWYLLRLGLVGVEGMDWQHKPIKRRGVTMLPEAALDDLDEYQIGFLSRVIGRVSGLPFGRSADSGS